MSVQKAQWTILTYIAAHNNLEALGQRSLDQILSVGSTPQLKLAALYDRHNGATRYIAGKPAQAAVEEPLGHVDSGDPDVLLETARWVFEQCPAEHYALVLWSHGSGWQPEDRERSAGKQGFSGWTPEEIARIAQQVRGDDDVSDEESAERAGNPGSMALFRTTLAHILKQDEAERAVCFDDGTGHSLDTLELERVVCKVHEMIGQPLDLLGMDACVMATLEVAYQVRQHVRYLVASEELVPGRSWPYDTILGKLHSAPAKDPHDLSALIVQQYVEYYTQNQPPLNYGDVTKVALDLSRINELVQPVNELSKALLADMEHQAQHLWKTQRETQVKETLKGQRDPSKFSFHLWDLGTLATHLAEHSLKTTTQETAQAVVAALQPGRAIIEEGHRGNWFDGIGGVSIYAVPPNLQRISPYYQEVALAKDMHWYEMLKNYHEVLL
jgi:hypothetical protein